MDSPSSSYYYHIITFFLLVILTQLSDLCIKTPLLFDVPAEQHATVCFYFEIQMAEHFEYDDIHIKYEIHVPDDCQTIDGTAQLKGCTHSSRRSAIDGCWSFGYCHELTLSCRLDCLLHGTVGVLNCMMRRHGENKMAVESLF